MNVYTMRELTVGADVAVDVGARYSTCSFVYGFVSRVTKNKLEVTVTRNSVKTVYNFSKVTGNVLGMDNGSYRPNVGLWDAAEAGKYVERQRRNDEERMFMQDTRNTLKAMIEGSIDETLAAKLRELANTLDARYVTVMEEVA
jgi:hypothetical protein